MASTKLTFRQKLGVAGVCFQTVFAGLFWGYSEYQSTVLVDQLGFSFIQLSLFSSMGTGAYLAAVEAVGPLQVFIPTKYLLMAGAVLSVTHGALMLTGILGLMVLGYILGGVGYAFIDTLAVPEMKKWAKRDDGLYRYLFSQVTFSECVSLFSGSVVMAFSVSFASDFLSWRLPWLLSSGGMLLVIALLVFGDFDDAMPEVANIPSIKTIARLYCTPAFGWHALGYGASAFVLGITSAWFTVIAAERFDQVSPSDRNLLLLAAEVLGIFVGFLGASALSKIVTLRSATYSNTLWITLAVVAAIALNFSASIYVYAGALATLFSAQYTVYFFMKNMPYMLGFRGLKAALVLAQLSVINSLSGDIIGVFVGGLVAQIVDPETVLAVGMYASLLALLAWVGIVFKSMLPVSYLDGDIQYVPVKPRTV